MVTIHITTMCCVQWALQCNASFILHPVFLSRPPYKIGISQLLKMEGTKAQRLPYSWSQLTDGWAGIWTQDWVNSYALLLSASLLFKIYSTNVIVDSKCKIKSTKEKETCQRVTEEESTWKKLLRKVIKPQVEASIMCSYVPCNSLAVASEGTLLLYAELFWW